MLRTHTCGELRAKDEGKEVSLAGWVHSIRQHGNVTFLDLRDRYGITQIVLSKEVAEIRRESVIRVSGKVVRKPKPNEKLATGEIEVQAGSCEILNAAEPLPMDPDADNTEETRLKYRYLDLRRDEMQHNLSFRSAVLQSVRKHLVAKDFLEIETPLLVKSTPEGARDYVVPSRVNPGRFYALPQSPQIYKQILMVSGFDRYFQIARCLRDEDLRADRQPEFTQIDVEMSFPEEDDIYRIGDHLVSNVVKDSLGCDITTPLPRLPYAEAIGKYGTDKPDIRFEMFLHDVTDLAKKSEFNIFAQADSVRCIVAAKEFSRKEIDGYTDLAKRHGAKGLAYVAIKDGGFDGSIAKFFPGPLQKELMQAVGAEEGSTIFFVADTRPVVNESLAQLRNKLGRDLQLYDPSKLAFLWVVDFPLFEWDEDEEDWKPSHHMFTMPKREHLDLLEKSPGKVLAQCYDLVLNGVELASGSIRVHNPEIQRKIMEAMRIPEEEAQEKFGFMLNAFRYGAPPHGGFAIGFDRLVAMLQGQNDIRDFIAFPKNKAAESPMDESPSRIGKAQLTELGLRMKEE